MKKMIVLLLAACCILSVMVLGASAATTNDTDIEARYDPRYWACMGNAANFRADMDTSESGNILGILYPGEHFTSTTLDPVHPDDVNEPVRDWFRGLPDTDSTIYQYYEDHPYEGTMPLGYIAAHLLGRAY